MAKINYKTSTSDGTEKTVYKSRNTRKVHKKVGNKGDYHDINISNQYIKSSKTGSGTSVNPYIYTLDLEDNFVNSISAKKTLSLEMIERIKLKENFIKTIKEKSLSSSQADKNKVCFQIDITGRNQTKSNTPIMEVTQLFGSEKHKINCSLKNDINTKIGRERNILFSVNGFSSDVKNITSIKYNLIFNNGKGKNSKDNKYYGKMILEDLNLTEKSSPRVSLDDVYDNSYKPVISLDYNKSVFTFGFKEKNMPLSVIYFYKHLSRYIGRKGEAYIQFHVEYN